MLKLFWTPAQGGGVPADVSWQARADSLAADGPGSVPLQNFLRSAQGAPKAAPALAARLDAWLAHRSHAAPLTIMVHGYQYDPRTGPQGADDPFRLIYGYPGTGVPAQLSFLPLVGECDEQGGSRAETAIAFAWLSSGGISDYGGACWNNAYQFAALDLVPLAATALAAVIAQLAAKGVRVRILAHSLGTRLTGQAIGLLRACNAATSIERVVLLGGAEFCVDAARAFAGCAFDVISLGSRQDAVLAVGAEEACHPVRPNGSAQACVIGRHGLGGNKRWLDFELSRAAVVQWFAAAQAPTGAAYQVNAVAEDGVHPDGNLCHWAYYTNHGNRSLVRDLVQHRAMTVARFAAAGAPSGMSSIMYGHFDGLPVPPTPPTCAERRGEILMAGGAIPQTG